MAPSGRQLRSGMIYPKKYTDGMKRLQKKTLFRPVEFLALPAEIRLQIYELLFDAYVLCWLWGGGRIKYASYHQTPFFFLATCKQVYNEGTAALYKLTRFNCSIGTDICTMAQGILHSMKTLKLDLITHLQLTLDIKWDSEEAIKTFHCASFSKWSELHQFPCLRTISILVRNYSQSPDFREWNAESRPWKNYPTFMNAISSLIRAIPLSIAIVAHNSDKWKRGLILGLILKGEILTKILSELEHLRHAGDGETTEAVEEKEGQQGQVQAVGI
ncbi:hypothetical protein NA57DRAFT_60084 [Rhizodiscina lignyota]|uniref:Uncharacterized protein n=1 Tax=Rhizodiscina lignyota TaxID=1504668 RepID=A0A9P4M1I7_9PEZI|nr:hypothetical protein NA57DRAFT_60084 [Rhizodiscina lignyota]